MQIARTRPSFAVTALLAAAALTGCTGGSPAATASAAVQDPKDSCRSFEAAANSFVDSLGRPADEAAESALTAMYEAAAFAGGDVQAAMGEALLALPADPSTPASKDHAKAANDSFSKLSEACKATGAEISLSDIPAG